MNTGVRSDLDRIVSAVILDPMDATERSILADCYRDNGRDKDERWERAIVAILKRGEVILNQHGQRFIEDAGACLERSTEGAKIVPGNVWRPPMNYTFADADAVGGEDFADYLSSTGTWLGMNATRMTILIEPGKAIAFVEDDTLIIRVHPDDCLKYGT